MIMVTGAAGFIGMHAVKALLERGDRVVGIDNLNDYYDPSLKLARLENIGTHPNFTFLKGDIADAEFLKSTFSEYKPTKVLNLAAQAGVRYSLENPGTYIQSNIVGFANILECCRHTQVEHLVYASSSSVYGANEKIPFSEADNVDRPVSLYAATKKSNELLAYTYSHLFKLRTTGLRFFTVYGPWGRPDMSPWLFTKAILEGRSIKVFNDGNMSRDFTYIDDITDGILKIITPPARNSTHELTAPYKLYNIGNNHPINLMNYIKSIELATKKTAKLELLPMQPGDMHTTYADISAIQEDLDFTPKTPLSTGLSKWVGWYLKYHNINH